MASVKPYGGHSSKTLRRVLVCEPQTAGWGQAAGWRELGYFHAPRLDEAESQHAGLVAALDKVGAEVSRLPGGDGVSLDAVYAHDASFPTNHGMMHMHMGKSTRRGEPDLHRRFFEAQSIPVLGTVEPPGLTEAGDMLWLDESTILIGEGYRTNAEGIDQVRNCSRLTVSK